MANIGPTRCVNGEYTNPELSSSLKGVKMAESKADEHWTEALSLAYTGEGGEFDDKILAHINSAIGLGLPPTKEAGIRVIRADVFARRKLWSEVEAEIRRALELDKGLSNSMLYVMAYKLLASSYEKRGQISRAVKTLEDAIAGLQTLYDPNEEAVSIASMLCELAVIYMSNRQQISSAEDQCLANLEHATRVAPDYPQTYAFLGVLFGSKELRSYDPKKAIGYYERHLTLCPPDDPARRISQEHIVLLRKEVTTKEQPKRGGFIKKLFG
jgi:tetratricopeptide (TPR) repeat protein